MAMALGKHEDGTHAPKRESEQKFDKKTKRYYLAMAIRREKRSMGWITGLIAWVQGIG
jgi:hypothetical protein